MTSDSWLRVEARTDALFLGERLISVPSCLPVSLPRVTRQAGTLMRNSWESRGRPSPRLSRKILPIAVSGGPKVSGAPFDAPRSS